MACGMGDVALGTCRGGQLMPWSDWQFWIVTIAAAVAAFLMLRPMLRSRSGKQKGTRTRLTLGGRTIDRHRSSKKP